MKKTLLTTILACCALIASAEEHTYTMSDYGKPSFTTSDGLFTTLGKKMMVQAVQPTMAAPPTSMCGSMPKTPTK